MCLRVPERPTNKCKITWVDWKVLRMLLFLFPGIRRGNAVLGFVKAINWRVWTCSWTAVAFSIWSQWVEAPSTFCHGGWGRRLCENTAEMWLNFVLNLGRAVMKHLKCYGKHMVVKHLAVLQYFSGGGTSKTVTRKWLTKHVLAGHPLRLRMSVLPRQQSCWKMTEGCYANFQLHWTSPSNALNTLWQRYCKCVVCAPGGYPGISQKSGCNNEFRCARTLFKCLRRFWIS